MPSTNFTTTAAVPVCITQAVNYLTRPLILTQSKLKVEAMKAVLCVALDSIYNPESTLEATLELPFSMSCLPPRPVFGACMACSIPWSLWMSLLGGRDFTLFIEPHRVSAFYPGAIPQKTVIWSELKTSLGSHNNLNGSHQVPISKLAQQAHYHQRTTENMASLRTTVRSAAARVQNRTLAQELLQSEEREEAEELFAMLSSTCILSPTPTRVAFSSPQPPIARPSLITTPTLPSPLESVRTLSEGSSSRPSSRSSNFSTFSFSDDDESITSASSVSSFDFPIPAVKKAPAFVPRQVQMRNAIAAAAASISNRKPTPIIDNSKKDVTKYLYQGGVSTVLTGGVMLGATGPSNSSKSAVPQYRSSIGDRKSPSAQKKNGATEQSWRR
ncbi:hypothetical protein CPC08DRAFT_709597 [Agrocybe pediades]|nr:hypothetical protein CPC08DRAFT_709597 [Agrocybe pediades]